MSQWGERTEIMYTWSEVPSPRIQPPMNGYLSTVDGKLYRNLLTIADLHREEGTDVWGVDGEGVENGEGTALRGNRSRKGLIQKYFTQVVHIFTCVYMYT